MPLSPSATQNPGKCALKVSRGQGLCATVAAGARPTGWAFASIADRKVCCRAASWCPRDFALVRPQEAKEAPSRALGKSGPGYWPIALQYRATIAMLASALARWGDAATAPPVPYHPGDEECPHEWVQVQAPTISGLRPMSPLRLPGDRVLAPSVAMSSPTFRFVSAVDERTSTWVSLIT